MGHAMVIIAYDDDRYGGAFQILNSYGPEWGNNGKIWIKYNDVIKYSGSCLTNIAEVVQHFNNLVKKRAIAFIISDFIENNLENALKITAKKHDLIALRIFDKLFYHVFYNNNY